MDEKKYSEINKAFKPYKRNRFIKQNVRYRSYRRRIIITLNKSACMCIFTLQGNLAKSCPNKAQSLRTYRQVSSPRNLFVPCTLTTNLPSQSAGLSPTSSLGSLRLPATILYLPLTAIPSSVFSTPSLAARKGLLLLYRCLLCSH